MRLVDGNVRRFLVEKAVTRGSLEMRARKFDNYYEAYSLKTFTSVFSVDTGRWLQSSFFEFVTFHHVGES